LTVQLRSAVTRSDTVDVRRIVESSGFFRPDEVQIAVELVGERLARGAQSGYEFLFADVDSHPVGYACFGPIGCTVASFDLYWLAVLGTLRGTGVGSRLLGAVEVAVAARRGSRIYVETSSRALYEPTRLFYVSRGYTLVAVLDDFYAPGDSKMIYVKVLPHAD